MRYLVTGATGFVGSAFIHSLSEQDSVIALTRDAKRASISLQKAHCSLKYITDLAELDNLNDVDCVLNLVGEPNADTRWTDSQKHKIQQSRLKS